MSYVMDATGMIEDLARIVARYMLSRVPRHSPHPRTHAHPALQHNCGNAASCSPIPPAHAHVHMYDAPHSLLLSSLALCFRVLHPPLHFVFCYCLDFACRYALHMPQQSVRTCPAFTEGTTESIEVYLRTLSDARLKTDMQTIEVSVCSVRTGAERRMDVPD